MAKRLVIDYGSDTLIDLDAPRQNLEQRFNLGGLVRQNYDKAGAVKQAIETDWPKIVKKWNEIFPPKAVEPKEAEILSFKEIMEPRIPGSGNISEELKASILFKDTNKQYDPEFFEMMREYVRQAHGGNFKKALGKDGLNLAVFLFLKKLWILPNLQLN
jgi:hypothetical protein